MVLQSDMMYPAVGYKHQHNYSHEEEDYYSQNSYNYSSMQMMRPKPTPTPPPANTSYMISSPQPSEYHVAMAPGDGYYGGAHYDHRNKDKFYENKDKFYEDFNVKEKYQQGGYGGHYDNHNKDKYYENNKEKYQDGYGHYENRSKDKYFENKGKFNEGFSFKEKHQDGYGNYETRNKDKYYENKEKFNEGFNVKEKEKYRDDGYGYGHGHGGMLQEGYKLIMDKMISGAGVGFGAETHFVPPHMRRPMAYDHEKKMDSWEFKGIDD